MLSSCLLLGCRGIAEADDAAIGCLTGGLVLERVYRRVPIGRLAGRGGRVRLGWAATGVAWIFIRLPTVFWKDHSPLARARPRMLKARKPWLCLRLTKCVSAMGPRCR